MRKKYFRDFLYRLVHLAFAAFLAASRNFFFPSFFALAGPPFNPPLRPRATAAGSFPSSSLLTVSGPTGSPVAISVIRAASWLMSNVWGFRPGLAMFALWGSMGRIARASRMEVMCHERKWKIPSLVGDRCKDLGCCHVCGNRCNRILRAIVVFHNLGVS